MVAHNVHIMLSLFFSFIRYHFMRAVDAIRFYSYINLMNIILGTIYIALK